MEISKGVFITFLRDNDFYDEWLKGYYLDNELYGDNIPLDDFFRIIEPRLWLYSGPSAMALLYDRPKEECDLQRRYDEWRNKNLNRYMELDVKWMDTVNIYKNNLSR